MNIQLFVSPEGKIAFTCFGEFEKKLEEIVLDSQTGVLTFVFKPDYEEWEPNCTVDLELCKILQTQIFCTIGYFKGKDLVATEYVPFMCRA